MFPKCDERFGIMSCIMVRKSLRDGSQVSGMAETSQVQTKEYGIPKYRPKRKKHVSRKVTGKRTKRDIWTQVSSTFFLAPSVIGSGIFFFVPFLVVIYYSMLNNPIGKVFVGLENFKSVAQNAAFRQAVHNTAVFSVVAVPGAVILSLILAMALDKEIPLRTQFRSAFLSPMMVPVASIVLIWQVLFDYNGAINEVILHFGGAKIDWLKSDKAIVVVVVLFLWKNLGYNMILFLAALSSIPKDIIEVAELEGATPRQIFFMIKIRYMASTIVFVTIMSLINSFKIFREVYLLTTDYPYEAIYMLQHYMNNKFRSLDYQALSAGAVLMSLVMIVIIWILFFADHHFGKDLEG